MFEQQKKASHISWRVLHNPTFPSISVGVFAKTKTRVLGVSQFMMNAPGAGPILHGYFLSPRVSGRDFGSIFQFPEMHNTPHETSDFLYVCNTSWAKCNFTKRLLKHTYNYCKHFSPNHQILPILPYPSANMRIYISHGRYCSDSSFRAFRIEGVAFLELRFSNSPNGGGGCS